MHYKNELKNYDIVLVSPPSRMINHYRPPLSLMYVGGYLQHRGMRVKIIDIPMKNIVRNKEFFKNIDIELKKIENQMINEFKELNTNIVGITFYTPEYPEVFRLAKEFKKINPDVKIIVGGIHPTLYPEEILIEKNSPIDFAVIGEGEVTTFELVNCINSNGKFENVEGIAFLDKDSKKVIKTGLRKLESDLDQISYPAYNLIDMDYYTNAAPYAIRGCFLRSMYILASRGCPSSCTFCVAKKLRTFNLGKKCVRIRSSKAIAGEILELKKKYNIDSFYFIDDLFTIDKKNVSEFCSEFKNKKLNLLWGCSSKVSTLNENVIKNMADAGCIQIDFGVERGSDKALRFVKKGISLKMIKNVFQLCHKYKIRTFANILVNVPSETEEDLKDIINLLNVLNSEVVSINIFTPYPGTEIYDNSTYKFSKEEYAMLISSTKLIYTYPEKLKFSSHNVNLLDWTRKYQNKYNGIWNNLKFYLSLKYIKILFKSKNKRNYIQNIFLLIREAINQKLA